MDSDDLVMIHGVVTEMSPVKLRRNSRGSRDGRWRSGCNNKNRKNKTSFPATVLRDAELSCGKKTSANWFQKEVTSSETSWTWILVPQEIHTLMDTHAQTRACPKLMQWDFSSKVHQITSEGSGTTCKNLNEHRNTYTHQWLGPQWHYCILECQVEGLSGVQDCTGQKLAWSTLRLHWKSTCMQELPPSFVTYSSPLRQGLLERQTSLPLSLGTGADVLPKTCWVPQVFVLSYQSELSPSFVISKSLFRL